MEEKSISLVASQAKIATVKRLLAELAEKNKELIVSKPKYGNVGSEILMNFTVPSKFHSLFVEKFLQLGIKVIGAAKEVKGTEGQNNEILKANTKIKTREKKTALDIQQIEKLAQAGRYNKIFEISTDNLTYTKDVLEKTVTLIPVAVKAAIEKLLDAALKSKYEAAPNIEALINIAVDQRLKTPKYNELRVKAGEAAVKACVIKERELHYLVEIANNNKMQEIVNYKAFIRFSDIVLGDKSNQFKDDLDIAARDINLRWMRIVADTVEDKFEGYDLYLFRRLFDYVEKHKK